MLLRTLIILLLALPLASRSHALPGPLSPCAGKARFHRDHLRELSATESSVLTASGARRWQEAVQLATQCGDSEVLDRMLFLRKAARGIVADALPEYLFQVYSRNPGLYL